MRRASRGHWQAWNREIHEAATNSGDTVPSGVEGDSTSSPLISLWVWTPVPVVVWTSRGGRGSRELGGGLSLEVAGTEAKVSLAWFTARRTGTLCQKGQGLQQAGQRPWRLEEALSGCLTGRC